MLILFIIFVTVGLLGNGLFVFLALRALVRRVPQRGHRVAQTLARALLGVCVVLAALQVWQWTLGRPSDDERDVSRVYRNFSYAMHAKDYALAFRYMTPGYKRSHTQSDLKEAFPFFTGSADGPLYMPWPDHEVHVAGKKAWLHPRHVGLFDLMSGPRFHFEKIHVPCSSTCVGRCYAKWYISEEYDWYTD